MALTLLAALPTKIKNILDGAQGRSSPMAGIAGDARVGTRLNELRAAALANEAAIDLVEADVAVLEAARDLVHSPGADANVATTTTETLFVAAGTKYTIPAGTAVVGDVYELRGWGTAVTSNCTIRARLGSISGTILGTVTVTAGASGHFEAWLRIAAIGATGSAAIAQVGGTAGSATSIDFTGDVDIVLTYEFAGSNGANVSTGLLTITKQSL